MDSIERSTLKRKEFPFFQVDNELFDLDLDLNIYQKIVYVYLCRCSNNGADAFPSYNTIAKKCCMSRRKAIDTVRELIDFNLLQKQVRRKSNNDNYSNLYVLNEPSAYCAPPSESDALPSEEGAPASECDAPKKETLNKNPIKNKNLTLEEDEQVIKAYKEVKGRYLNSRERKVLKELLQSHSKDLILKAIDVMVTDAEKITLKYITSTLQDWKSKGIQTVEEVDKMRLEWQESKKKHIRKPTEYKPKGKVSNFNNFKQRDYDFNDLEKKLTNHEEVLKEADCSKCVVCRNGKCFIGKELVDGKCANYNEKNVG